MKLVRDILDKQLVDRNGRNMGKVDGLVVEIAPGHPPRVVAIAVGPVTLARRLGHRLGNYVRKLFSRSAFAGEYRIPWKRVKDIGIDIQVDIDSERTPALDLEHWLSKRVIRRIPGA